MKKIHIIFFVMLGLLLMPSISYACGGTKKHSCKKEISSNAQKGCCANHDHSKNSKGCGGKCGHKSCGCANGCISGATLIETARFIGFANPTYFFKANFYAPKNFVSSGFHSLWLIPKIS
jgi:hypothetical protein